MNRMLNKISSEEIIAIIEESLSEYCAKIAQQGNALFKTEAAISWVKTLPTFWPNFILSADFKQENVGDLIQQIILQMKSGTLPSGWVVGPKSNPKNLCDYLETNGFKKKYNLIGMAIDLTRINTKVSLPSDVNIQIVDNKDLLSIWCEIVSKGLFHDNLIESRLYEHLLNDAEVKFYIAFHQGKAVAASMMQLSSDIASINIVATLESSRNMGIGTAMTLRPLLDAYQMSGTIGVLQASLMGEPVYKKLGFEEYCKFYVYDYE